MAYWRYIICDRAGTELGEVFQAGSRDHVRPLNAGLDTLTFSLALDNPMVDVIQGLELDAEDRLTGLVKAYRRSSATGDYWRAGVMDLLTATETGDENGARLDVAAAGPFWRLAGRLIGKGFADGKGVGYADGTALAPKDPGTIAHGILAVLNAEDDTGIRSGSIIAGAPTFVGPWYFKPASEAILELGPGSLGGYDFELAPTEPTADVDGVQIATLNTVGVLGELKPNAVLEYGTGRRNLSNYQRIQTRDTEANEVYHLPPGFPDLIADGDTIITGSSASSILARGKREAVVGADLGVTDLRQKLVDSHVAIRKQPRETIMVTPAPNIGPEPGIDYDVGDLVEARAVFEGKVRFDGIFRIYGIRFAIDDMGNETPVLTLINDQ